MTEQPQVPVRYEIELPDSLSGGVHADMANIWHTAESFTLDFMALKTPPYPVENDLGGREAKMDVVVTARVHMPPTHVIELMKALGAQLDKWERETGQSPPGGSSAEPLPGSQ